MFGSMVLDVAIGLALVYSFLSVIASAVSEAISGMLGLRAKTLETAVQRLLGNPEMAKSVYANPLIKGLAKSDKSTPSYIPAEVFAMALIQELGKDMARMQAQQGAPAPGVAAFSAGQGQQGWQVIDMLRAAVYNRGVSSGLQMLLGDSKVTDLKSAKKAIEGWFDMGMERSSGWYKRKTHIAIVLVSFVVTLALNVDSFRIARAISQNATLRETIVASYANSVKTVSSPEAMQQPSAVRVVQIQQELAKMSLPIGWEIWPDKGYSIKDGILISIPGWLVTAMAASLGAPFWFDILNKLVNLRAGGKPPEPKKDPEEKEKGQA
jgi:hypothetical protein